MSQTTHEQDTIPIRRRPKLYEPIVKDKTTPQKEATEKKSIPGSNKETLSGYVTKHQASKKTTVDVQVAGAKSTTTNVEINNIAATKSKLKTNQLHHTKPPVKEDKKPGARPKQTSVLGLNQQLPKTKKERKANRRCSWSNDEVHEICIDVLMGECKYGDECKRLHGTFPFQWQHKDISMRDSWTSLSFNEEDNQRVEKLFSDPTVQEFYVYLSDLPHRFDALTVSIDCLHKQDIRRLSTRSTVSCDSSLLEPYCIEWQWYWKDDDNSWIQYAQKNHKGSHSIVSGNKLEVAYESYLRGEGPSVFKFQTQKHKYELDFVSMVQKNSVYGTQRTIQRRPKYSMSEHKQIASQLQQQEKRGGTRNMPKTWDTKGMRPNHPMVVPLDKDRHSNEYKKVANMFWNTMEDKTGSICAIKRVQNLELWEYYSIRKEHMREKNKGYAVEKQLWHGTSKESSEPICRQNFDFRISGSNVGTKYGQGSYFASNAKFSDGYTKPESHIRRMFLARVLIGRFVKGEQSYKRPPPVNPNDPLGDHYDSCVDNEEDPSIFVTFDKSQAYPEYLIEYKRSSDITSPPSMPASTNVKSNVSVQSNEGKRKKGRKSGKSEQ